MAQETGKTIINFEGLSPEAAEKLASGMANAAGSSIRAILGETNEMKGLNAEEIGNMEKLLSAAAPAAHGNCGNGCAA